MHGFMITMDVFYFVVLPVAISADLSPVCCFCLVS